MHPQSRTPALPTPLISISIVTARATHCSKPRRPDLVFARFRRKQAPRPGADPKQSYPYELLTIHSGLLYCPRRTIPNAMFRARSSLFSPLLHAEV
jgi:hypothetical protein